MTKNLWILVSMLLAVACSSESSQRTLVGAADGGDGGKADRWSCEVDNDCSELAALAARNFPDGGAVPTPTVVCMEGADGERSCSFMCERLAPPNYFVEPRYVAFCEGNGGACRPTASSACLRCTK